jgi:hypothetical protein
MLTLADVAVTPGAALLVVATYACLVHGISHRLPRGLSQLPVVQTMFYLRIDFRHHHVSCPQRQDSQVLSCWVARWNRVHPRCPREDVFWGL